MAESSLTLGWPELKVAVGVFLDFGGSGWTSAQTTKIESIVQSGIRRVYYPPASGNHQGYEWTWLRPWTTLDMIVDDYDRDLPDEFGRMIGDFHYDADEHRRPVKQVPIATIMKRRAQYDESGYANIFAIRYKESDGSGGQRQEVLFFPTPDAIKTLNYQFEAYQNVLADAYPYPLGGMQMSELYKQSCLAVAETEVMDEIGLHNQLFEAMLVDAIARDRKRTGSYGNMGHRERHRTTFRRGYTGSTYDFTYEGTPY